MQDKIVIHGAPYNLKKNIDVPNSPGQIGVWPGCLVLESQSGADTLYAEGQRRYVESLSAYARQFLGNGKTRWTPLTAWVQPFPSTKNDQ